MRPDRLVIGEVREAEALDMLIALNSGLPGLSTIHANSAHDALTKICTLPLLAGENISAALRRPHGGGLHRPGGPLPARCRGQALRRGNHGAGPTRGERGHRDHDACSSTSTGSWHSRRPRTWRTRNCSMPASTSLNWGGSWHERVPGPDPRLRPVAGLPLLHLGRGRAGARAANGRIETLLLHAGLDKVTRGRIHLRLDHRRCHRRADRADPDRSAADRADLRRVWGRCTLGARAPPGDQARRKPARAVARRGRSPAFGDQGGNVAARGADPARCSRGPRHCARHSPTSAWTTGRPPASTIPSNASPHAWRTRSPTRSSRPCASPARSEAPTWGRCSAPSAPSCATRPAPAGNSRPGSPGRCRRPGWPSPHPGSSCCCLAGQPAAVIAYSSVTGMLVLVGGLVVSFVCYRAMMRIGRLPEEERVFR